MESVLAFSEGLKMRRGYRDPVERAAQRAERRARASANRAWERAEVAAEERQRRIWVARAERVERIQRHYYPGVLANYPLQVLPIPPTVWFPEARRLWDAHYRAWRDAVQSMLAVVTDGG